MKKLYLSISELEKALIQNFGLNEHILMENAASYIEYVVREKLNLNSKVLVICGTGNNAADGLCVARKLCGDYDVSVMLVSDKLNTMAKYQLSVLEKIGVKFTHSLDEFDCYVDAIFGSGLSRDLSDEISILIDKINNKNGLKIAIDVPTGINKLGQISKNAFKSDMTVTMGALKLGLFLDEAKDFVGDIRVANLGISRINFEQDSNYFLLERDDLKLPFRRRQNTNKGEFGHLFVISGDMGGASILSGLAANAIGAGLVSLVSDENILNLPNFLMQKKFFLDAKFIVVGMGLGNKKINLDDLVDKICVIDADLCYNKDILNLLTKNKNLVLTPHPKEFTSLLKIANIADVSVSEVQKNRFELAKIWSEKFESVLVLKGANTIIAQNGKLFVSNFGNSSLAKGGSGDALAGIIGGLLAQGYLPLDAAINGVLAHALSLHNFKKNSYALNPIDIIEGVKCL